MYNKLISRIVLWVAAVTTVLTVNAQQFGFKDLGIEGGEFEEWQKLTVGYGEPGNVADVAGSSQKAKLTQKTPGAMATGGGNIYNPGGVSVFEVSGSIEGVLSQITLQVWSAGSPVDSGSYVFKSGDLEVKGTSSEVGSGDAGVISLISFDLGESKVESAHYSIEFKASVAHMSLVALRLDLAREEAVVVGFKDLGIEGGEFEEWQKLTVGYGEPGNVADVAGSSQQAKLTQKAPGAMATGGGNIYNPGGASVFEVSGSIEGVLSQIALQVWSDGAPVDSGSYVFKSGDLEVKGTSSEVGSGDAGVISLISFDLGESKVEGADYSIEFKASGAHMSLVALRLDLAQVTTELGFNQFDKPGWIYDGWITFTEEYGDWNAPDMEGSNEITPVSGALLKQSVPGAMLISGGNIYHPGAASSFVIDDLVEGGIGRVVLQVWTSGSPMNTSQVILKSGDIELSGSYSEIERKRSGHGYEIISQFNFDLGDSNVSDYTIEFGASGPHMSLVSVKLSKLVNIKYDFKKQQTVAIDNPSDDRWTYPRNGTPGTRNLAPVFGYISGDGEEIEAVRLGQLVVGYDTSGVIPVGLNREQYKIKSVIVEATVALDKQFKYDGTRDDYSLYNGVDDTVSPVELFGAGFRNGYDALNWDEEVPLKDDGVEENNIYSIGFDGDIAIDVDTFSFNTPHSARPFAIGTIEGLEQDDLVPEDSVFVFKLDLENSAVSNYIAEGLGNGKLYFTLSQILYEELEEGGKGHPDIYTKDHILGEGVRVMIEYELLPPVKKPAYLTMDRLSGGKLLISWNQSGNLERSESLGASAEWSTVKTTGMSHIAESPNGKNFFRLRGD